MGAGRTEVVRALFGLDPISSGSVSIKGQSVSIKNIQDSIAHGMVMVSEDRKRYGIIPVRDVKENISLSSLEKVFGTSLASITARSASATPTSARR